MKKTFIERLMDWIGFIGSILLAGAYLAWGLINLKETGKSVMEIIGEAALIFALSQAMTLLLRIQGILLGKKSQAYTDTLSLFGDTVVKCAPIIEYGEEFVIEENRSALKQVRIQILSTKGMKYEDHFDEDGRFKDSFYVVSDKKNKLINKRIKDKNVALNNAVNARVTMLQFNDLTASDSHPSDPNYLGTTETQYLLSRSLMGILLGAATAILFSYYGYELIRDFKKEDLIYKAIQISFILIIAIIQLLLSYLNVIGAIRNRMVRQINKLEKFYYQYSNIPKKKPLDIGKPVEKTELPNKSTEGSVSHEPTTKTEVSV
jgi:hypothetical protein